ncbi:MAG: hypothetical protein F6K21_26995 [Symploca sp. SIO2D2]|nr:hypothetical protein [Symploca sp. SIO2D2]
MKACIYLSVAIVVEIVGTSVLKSSDGFTKLAPSILLTLAFGRHY